MGLFSANLCVGTDNPLLQSQGWQAGVLAHPFIPCGMFFRVACRHQRIQSGRKHASGVKTLFLESRCIAGDKSPAMQRSIYGVSETKTAS
jgi:hypothetical protein